MAKQALALVGECPAIVEAQKKAKILGPAETRCVITGESGTGKEVYVRDLHRLSPRSKKPFVPVNMSAVPEALAESELFGHVKGAFTGAVADRLGKLRSADGGFFVLDEVTEMSPSVQAKLLRVVEQGEVWPVGAKGPVKVDVVLHAITNRRLDIEVEEGRFREDLWHRLAVVVIWLPPLRERGDDIHLITDALLRRLSRKLGRSIRPPGLEFRDVLAAYSWPGNVRELLNALEVAAVFSKGGILRPEHLPTRVLRGAPDGSAPGVVGPFPTVAEMERHLVVAALNEAGGNRSKAGALVGLSRGAVCRRMEKHEISLPLKSEDVAAAVSVVKAWRRRGRGGIG